MIEVLHASFLIQNIVPTLFLLLALIYWITVMLGALDLGFLDFDLDADYESDIEIEVDFDGEIDAETGEATALAKLLSFFNLGKIPFMVFFTALATPMWFIAVVTNDFLNSPVWLGLLLLIPNFITSMFIAKILTQPFVGLFKRMEADEMKNEDMVGKICTAKYDIDDQNNSQAEVNHKGTSFLLTVRTSNGKEIKKGDTAVVVQHFADRHIYIVEPYNQL